MKTTFYATLFASMLASTAFAAEIKGYLYTTLNGETINQVITFERNDVGTIGAQRAYSKGSLGGGNTVSVFGIDRSDDSLDLVDSVASGGTRPVSIAYQATAPGSGDYWVVVGNQWNNPNVQKGGGGEGAIEMYPDAAFHAAGGGHEAALEDRNIQLFSFDADTGSLMSVATLDTHPGTNGGPTTVAFNPGGTKLAVSTWRIAHLDTETLTHQKPSRVYVYDFDRTDGSIANERFFEEDGISGGIGFSWDKNSDNVFVSNFNLTGTKRDHSLTALHDDGRKVSKVSNFGTGDGADIDDGLLKLTSADGSKLYVASFGENFISEFDVNADGVVWGC